MYGYLSFQRNCYYLEFKFFFNEINYPHEKVQNSLHYQTTPWLHRIVSVISILLFLDVYFYDFLSC